VLLVRTLGEDLPFFFDIIGADEILGERFHLRSKSHSLGLLEDP
jgi:hypothetical protein